MANPIKVALAGAGAFGPHTLVACNVTGYYIV